MTAMKIALAAFVTLAFIVVPVLAVVGLTELALLVLVSGGVAAVLGLFGRKGS